MVAAGADWPAMAFRSERAGLRLPQLPGLIWRVRCDFQCHASARRDRTSRIHAEVREAVADVREAAATGVTTNQAALTEAQTKLAALPTTATAAERTAAQKAVTDAQASLESAQQAVALAKRAVWVLVALTIVLIAASVLVARNRWRAALWLGLGGIAAMVITRSVVNRVVDEAPELATQPGGRAAISERDSSMWGISTSSSTSSSRRSGVTPSASAS